MAQRSEHRPARAGDAGCQRFIAEIETHLDHSRGCPNVVCECRFKSERLMTISSLTGMRRRMGRVRGRAASLRRRAIRSRVATYAGGEEISVTFIAIGR